MDMQIEKMSLVFEEMEEVEALSPESDKALGFATGLVTTMAIAYVAMALLT